MGLDTKQTKTGDGFESIARFLFGGRFAETSVMLLLRTAAIAARFRCSRLQASTACAAARADWAEEVGSTGSVVMIGRVDICDPEAGVSFKIACWVGATNRVLVAISVSQARFTTLSETKARNTNMARLFFMAISE
jgi:hypothetical protein